MKRRTFLTDSLALAGPAVLAANTLAVGAPPPALAADPRLNVICIGAHPDDPESGCAGTLARYTEQGHSVAILYLTRGERGIRDKSLQEAAKIRSAESESACKIIGARPLFFGQIDGATQVTAADVNAMTKLLSSENANIVFTHWPIDTHMDHQVASFLSIRACMAQPQPPHLYFFEVDTGAQSQGFFPNTYVDVSSVLEKKKSALLAHNSQNGEEIWRQHHQVITTWRGREAGVSAAEAFVHLNRDTRINKLPGD